MSYRTALVFVLALAIRVPFRSQYAYHWDSAQFALAVEHYDMRIGLPHRPGYFLYVMAGRAVNCFLHDPHASLVWVSVFSGAVLAAAGYRLGTDLFGRGCGLATAIILATSPLCWFSSEVALTNITDAAAVTVTMWAVWRAIQRGGTWGDVVTLAACLAVVAGIRQQTAPVLLPAWLYAFARFRSRRLLKLLAGIALSGALCLLWFVPMVEMSGGFTSYRELLQRRALIDAPFLPWNGGPRMLWDNTAMILASCWAGLLAAGILATAELIRSRNLFREHREQLCVLCLWIVPMVGLGVIYTARPDYVLSYFPAIAILAGACLSGRWLGIAVVAIVNVIAFLSSSPIVLGLPVTAATIRNHDRQLGAWTRVIRERYRPEEVVICHANQNFSWGFRQFQYHLPAYENFLVRPDPALAPPFDSKLWSAVGTDQAFVDQLPSNRVLVLFVPPGKSLESFAPYLDVSEAREVEGTEGRIFERLR